MSLGRLISRLGIGEVARRVGVSVGTVNRWARHGVSSSWKSEVQAVGARHERSRAAAQTRKKAQRVSKGIRVRVERDEFQREVADAAEVPEKEAPREAPKPRKIREYQTPGRVPIESFRYIGETITFTIGQPVATVDAGAWAEQAVRTWETAVPFRDFCRVIFLFFRFVPPQVKETWYRGTLVPKKGRWVDFWTSTKAWSSRDAIRDAVENAVTEVAMSGGSVAWLEQMQVNVFEYREDLPSVNELVTRRLQ